MPGEIGSTVVNPAAFTRPTPQQAQQGQRSRDGSAQSAEASPAATRAAGSEALLSAPDPAVRGQEAENQLESRSESGRGSGSPPETNEQSQPADAGVGGTVDMMI